MADRLTLSCWIRGYHPLTMPDHWERMLGLFPFSKLQKGVTTCRVLAVSESEPPIFENVFPAPFDPLVAVSVAREFSGEDCACQVEAAWDLMLFDRDWRLAPAKVSLWCFAPGFDNETGDHLRIELGPEDPFLPEHNSPVHVRVAQSNLLSLTRLVSDVTAALPIEKKLLWSESGENFAEKIERALTSARGPGAPWHY